MDSPLQSPTTAVRLVGLRIGVALAGLLACLGATALAAQAEHPTLVDVATTDCGACHGEVLKRGAVVHAAAEQECTVCHEFASAGGTTVALADEEPGLCLLCHDELETAARMELDSSHVPVADSCLTCHDPHSSEEPRLLKAAMPNLCEECHALAELQPSHGSQLTGSARCTACHLPHGSKNAKMLRASHQHAPFAEGSCEACHRSPFGDRVRLRARNDRLCASCHASMTAEAGDSGSIHPPVAGERRTNGCLRCHDPHMSPQTALLLEPGNQLCAECHSTVVAAAEAETGHLPAADDCLTCHQPHASAEAQLLSAPVGEICSDCHDLADDELRAAHLGKDPAALECVRCHTPHGAGQPKLLAATLHAPVLDGCDICHEGAFDQLAEGGPPELCLLCHDEIQEAAANAPVQHAALELGSCTDCHDPHATPQPHLVKAPGAGPCVDCHDDVAPAAGEFGHGVIDEIGCSACHEPHGGERQALLRMEATLLCRSCHDPARALAAGVGDEVQWLGRFPVSAERATAVASLRLVRDGTRGHPVQNHPIEGTFDPASDPHAVSSSTFAGQLDCLTCHDPHKGRAPQLLRWDARGPAEACSHCHTDK